MKRIVSNKVVAADVSITPENYLEEIEEDTGGIEVATDKIISELKTIYKSMQAIQVMTAKYKRDMYIFDNYNMRNPEEESWFEDAPRSVTDECYDAWNTYFDAGDNYQILHEAGKAIAVGVDHILNKIEQVVDVDR